MKIHCTYCPNSNHPNLKHDLIKLVNQNNPYVIGGDLNCKHQNWNCLRSNKGGRCLRNLSMNYPNCTILAPENPTRYSASGTANTLDIFISNNNIPVYNVTTRTELSSDHFPVTCSLSLSAEQIHSPQTRFNYKASDWIAYGVYIDCCLENYCNDFRDQLDIDLAIESLNKFILTAREISVPKIFNTRYDNLILPEKVHFLIRYRNTLRRQWIRTRCFFIKNAVNFLNRMKFFI